MMREVLVMDREVAAVSVGLRAAPAGVGSRGSNRITRHRVAFTGTVLKLIVHRGAVLSSEG